MIKSKEEMPHRPIEIDLTGPDGNVFVLMGYARQYAKQLFDKIEPEMEFEHSMTEAFRELYDEEFESAKDMGEFITNQMNRGKAIFKPSKNENTKRVNKFIKLIKSTNISIIIINLWHCFN